MAWQEFVFLGGNFLLGIVLIPTILDDDSCIPLTTSLPTSLALYAFAFPYVTLEMPISAASTLINALLWSYIAGFKNKRFDIEFQDFLPSEISFSR